MKKVILFALIAALLAGALLYFYLDTLEQKEQTQIVYEDVVVAATDIPAYTTITAGMVTTKKMPLGYAHLLSTRSKDDVIGYVTEDDISAGEEILPSKLKQLGDDASGLSYIVPAGMRAVTISVDEISGVAGLLQRGDYVDVIIFTGTSYELPKEEDQQAAATAAADETTEAAVAAQQQAEEEDSVTQSTTVVAAQNVRVAALGTSLTSSSAITLDTGEMPYSSVTLYLTPEEAMRVIQGEKSGSIMLLLRASGDHDANEESPVVSDSLLEPAS